ncbi:hypothetical protein CK501_10020 [Halovibrio salipaludis]|uniref:DUF4397 domain-containing protein n=1 Tax=Halovibrio salipaludis TaxID=2032626 RepID=A0A2A2F5L4_9GAMM|nr:DUF4397 domain-containing protein [Halovibrio salipaludis]PAU80736.1 hypothetical protein CK501_10020 [Halovibrio salipaludis]
MESPARAALLVAVTLGLSGCFESQRDETFNDTVAGDDVDVRVLHAVTDAPALRLEADGEVQTETLDYGRVATFSLPANHYRFEAAGYTGREAPEPLLDNLEGNLTEGMRHDLLLAGSLEDSDARAILLEQDDEPFEPEEEDEENGEEEGDGDGDSDGDEPLRDVRFRVAHLAPDFEAVDLYLGGDTSGSPDVTLPYGNASEALRVESGVYRVQITPAGGSNVIYDSDRVLGWDTGDDLLLAVTPATGVQGEGDLSLIEVDGEQSRRVPDMQQDAGFEFVNASTESVEVASAEGPIATDTVDPLGSKAPEGYEGVEAGSYTLAIDSQESDASGSYGLSLARAKAGTVVLRALPPSSSDESTQASLLINDARPVATNARARILNTWFKDPENDGQAEPVDVYLVEGSGCESPLSGNGVVPEPVVSNLSYGNSSSMLPVQAGDYQLVVTEPGDPGNRLLCDDSVSLKTQGLYELVVARPQGSSESGLIQVSRVR